MSEWNHRTCERCWFDGCERFVPREGASGGYEHVVVPPVSDEQMRSRKSRPEEPDVYLMPNQVRDAEPGPCCFCGGMTITGIFVRRDENDVLCRGRHDDPSSWSRVSMAESAT